MLRVTSPDNPLNVLLIEDSKGDAILVIKALTEAMNNAVTITTARTLREALALLTEETYDVALLDKSLPDVVEFSGLHSIQNISPELPVVFLTAHRDENIALEAIIQGAQDYLYKDTVTGHVVKRAIQYAVLRKQFEGVLIARANYDMLTGLANRMLFESRLDMALARVKRQPGNISVFFIDLDKFKQVNDTLGHAAGDSLLKQVAERMKGVLRKHDTAARFGGDEFAILLEHMQHIDNAEIVAHKIVSLFDTPFEISGNDVYVGVSVGIASCDHTHQLTSDIIMRKADQAMYEAKSIEGNVFTRYARPVNIDNYQEESLYS